MKSLGKFIPVNELEIKYNLDKVQIDEEMAYIVLNLVCNELRLEVPIFNYSWERPLGRLGDYTYYTDRVNVGKINLYSCGHRYDVLLHEIAHHYVRMKFKNKPRTDHGIEFIYCYRHLLHKSRKWLEIARERYNRLQTTPFTILVGVQIY